MNIRGVKLHDFNCPMIMGVINVTPDSFYEDSRLENTAQIISKVEEMVSSGAQIIDIGGVSTRPGADLLSTQEELNRVLPVIKAIRSLYPDLLISIDTFRADVAREAVSIGANIINDVYGGKYDEQMFDTVAELQVPYILMHSRGDANNMQDLCEYMDVTQEVCLELSQSIALLRSKGVKDIIVDPGFGFAKNLSQNYELFQNLSLLTILDCPILLGISRKSMIYKLLNTDTQGALNGTSILNTVGIMKGASIIRVHDVKEANEVLQIISMMKK